MSMKCPQCGLVNFASAAECKRCQLTFVDEPEGAQGWGAPGDFQQAQSGHSQSHAPGAAERGAQIGKVCEWLAMLGVLAIVTAKYVHILMTLVGLLMLVGSLVTGIVALVKIKKGGNLYRMKTKVILSTGVSAVCLLFFAVVVPAIAIPNLLRAAAAAGSLQTRDNPDWREYRSESAGYMVQMPGQPTEKAETKVNLKGRLEIKETRVSSPDGSGCFVAFTDFTGQVPDASPEEILNAGLNAGVAQAKATLVNKKSVMLDGYPGVEGDLLGPQTPSPQDRQRMTLRIYWAQPRMYILAITAPEETRLDAERATFLDSFRLTE
jgi:hypothetical protein